MSPRFAAVALSAVLLAGCAGPAVAPGGPSTTAAAPTESKTLTVLTHDSFALSEATIAAFKTSSGYDVKFVAPGDVGTLVNQLVLTKDSPLGDVVYVELPKARETFAAHESFGSVESVKAVSEIFTPASSRPV